MSKRHWLQLICLAAIWGSSFIFMRVLAPVLGPALTSSARARSRVNAISMVDIKAC